MTDYGTMIRNVFEMGSIRDAKVLFEACVHNAFPTFAFRNLELIRFMREDQYMEGESWNHVLKYALQHWRTVLFGKSTATV